MDRPPPAMERALLDWVSVFNLSPKVTRLEELQDGQVIWNILVVNDPDSFTGDLPGDTAQNNWVPRWENLKHIDREIRSHLSNKLNKLAYYNQNITPDLKAAAEKGKASQIAQILKLVVYVAVVSPSSVQRQLALFEKLDKNTSNSLIEMIKEMDDKDQKLATVVPEPDTSSDIDTPASRPASQVAVRSSGDPIERDLELEYEEKLIQARRRARDLEKTVEDLERELKEAQGLIANLEEQVHDTRFSVEREIEEKRAREQLEQLSAKERSDRTVIADLEAELNEARSELERQKRHIARLTADATSKQELRDQVQILTVERDDLTQKTKANENLKKKIQSLQDVERHYQSLLLESKENQTKLTENQKKLEELDRLKKHCDRLTQTIEENAQTIPNLETEIQTSEQRRRILQKELHEVRELHKRQIEAMDEMKSQVPDGQNETPAPALHSNLDDELTAYENSEIQPDPLIDTPKVEVDETGPEHLVPKQKLQIVVDQNERLKERSLEVLEERQGLLNSIEKLKGVKSTENTDVTEPFLKQREKLLSVEAELERIRAENFSSGVENAKLRDQLTKTGADSSEGAPDTTTVESSPNVQANLDKTIRDFQTLNRHHEGVMVELRDTRDLLDWAIKFKSGIDDLDESEYYRTIEDTLIRISARPAGEREELCHNFAKDVAAQLKSSKDRVEAMTKRLEHQTTSYEAMKQELEQAKKDVGSKADDVTRQELANLQRENNLMTSAWYSMTSRLQSNTVVLARRTEAPKSWIRRQQAVVGGAHSIRR